jgi:uncharacterized protein YqhQ
VILNLIEIHPAFFSLKYEGDGTDFNSSAFLSNKFAKIVQYSQRTQINGCKFLSFCDKKKKKKKKEEEKEKKKKKKKNYAICILKVGFRSFLRFWSHFLFLSFS